ncbi:hypothetical protein Hanom_Chr03g00189001 [Helianthus anomalus]
MPLFILQEYISIHTVKMTSYVNKPTRVHPSFKMSVGSNWVIFKIESRLVELKHQQTGSPF